MLHTSSKDTSLMLLQPMLQAALWLHVWAACKTCQQLSVSSLSV
jgi:hypothetical protein